MKLDAVCWCDIISCDNFLDVQNVWNRGECFKCDYRRWWRSWCQFLGDLRCMLNPHGHSRPAAVRWVRQARQTSWTKLPPWWQQQRKPSRSRTDPGPWQESRNPAQKQTFNNFEIVFFFRVKTLYWFCISLFVKSFFKWLKLPHPSSQRSLAHFQLTRCWPWGVPRKPLPGIRCKCWRTPRWSDQQTCWHQGQRCGGQEHVLHCASGSASGCWWTHSSCCHAAKWGILKYSKLILNNTSLNFKNL